MPRFLAVATLCLTFLNSAPTSAADRDEYFKYWAKFVGTWQLENQPLELKVTRSESGACFIFAGSAAISSPSSGTRVKRR